MKRTKYTKDMPEKAKKLAQEGLINLEIAKQLGISEDSFYKYMRLHPEFREAVDEGKVVVDDKVESMLLKRALGYDYEETKVIADEEGRPVQFIKTKKHASPDVGAAAFWLKNRRPEKWRDRRDVDVKSSGEGIVFNIRSAEEYEQPKED